MHLNGAPMQQKLINAKPVDQFLRNFENTLQMQRKIAQTREK